MSIYYYTPAYLSTTFYIFIITFYSACCRSHPKIHSLQLHGDPRQFPLFTIISHGVSNINSSSSSSSLMARMRSALVFSQKYRQSLCISWSGLSITSFHQSFTRLLHFLQTTFFGIIILLSEVPATASRTAFFVRPSTAHPIANVA